MEQEASVDKDIISRVRISMNAVLFGSTTDSRRKQSI